MNARTITESLVRLARLGVVVEIRKAKDEHLNGLEVVAVSAVHGGTMQFIPFSEIGSEPAGRALADVLTKAACHFEDATIALAKKRARALDEIDRIAMRGKG